MRLVFFNSVACCASSLWPEIYLCSTQQICFIFNSNQHKLPFSSSRWINIFISVTGEEWGSNLFCKFSFFCKVQIKSNVTWLALPLRQLPSLLPLSSPVTAFSLSRTDTHPLSVCAAAADPCTILGCTDGVICAADALIRSSSSAEKERQIETLALASEWEVACLCLLSLCFYFFFPSFSAL